MDKRPSVRILVGWSCPTRPQFWLGPEVMIDDHVPDFVAFVRMLMAAVCAESPDDWWADRRNWR